MNDYIKKHIFNIKSLKLVDLVYEALGDESLQVQYLQEKDKYRNTQGKVSILYENIYTKIMIVLMIIWNLLFTVFINFIGFIAFFTMIALIHKTIDFDSYLNLCIKGCNLFETLISSNFGIDINTILQTGFSNKLNTNLNVDMYTSDIIYVFYSFYFTVISMLCWVTYLVVSIFKKSKLQKELSYEEGCRFLKVTKYDSLLVVQRKLQKKYWKLAYLPSGQKKCAQAYVQICKTNEFYDLDLDKNQKKLVTKKRIQWLILNITNLLCLAHIAGVIITAYLVQIISGFIIYPEFSQLLQFLEKNTAFFKGGYYQYFSIYQNASVATQHCFNLSLFLTVILVLLNTYKLVYVRTKTSVEQYQVYLKTPNPDHIKFKLNYNYYSFLVIIFIVLLLQLYSS